MAWLMMLVRGDPLSLLDLCFHVVQVAFVQTRLVSEVLCGLARRVGKEVACFHFKRCASTRSKLHLLPTRLVSGVLCGLAHHVGMKWLAFTSRAVLPLGPSCTIANQTRFRASSWLGSSCW